MCSRISPFPWSLSNQSVAVWHLKWYCVGFLNFGLSGMIRSDVAGENSWPRSLQYRMFRMSTRTRLVTIYCCLSLLVHLKFVLYSPINNLETCPSANPATKPLINNQFCLQYVLEKCDTELERVANQQPIPNTAWMTRTCRLDSPES